MTLTVADDPPDRLRWVSETIRLLADGTDEWRAQLLARVEQASDADLAAGSDDDWGVGQIAVHLLITERGVTLIALRLAQGQEAGSTGQPRPAASAVTRPGTPYGDPNWLRLAPHHAEPLHRPRAGPRPGAASAI